MYTKSARITITSNCFLVKNNSIYNECWSTFTCLIFKNTSTSSTRADLHENWKCVVLIEQTCPAVSILFGHIYFACHKNIHCFWTKHCTLSIQMYTIIILSTMVILSTHRRYYSTVQPITIILIHFPLYLTISIRFHREFENRLGRP